MKKLLLATVLLISSVAVSFSQDKTENFKVVWPKEYKWKKGTDQDDKSIHMVEIVPEKETVDKWTLLGTMITIKGVTNSSVNDFMNTVYEEFKKNSPAAKLTMIEKDDKAKHNWILFKIEAPGFITDKTPESDLFYIIQGETCLFTNCIATKEKSLSKSFFEKWSKVFKTSELVYE
jgi:hypothetical protein